MCFNAALLNGDDEMQVKLKRTNKQADVCFIFIAYMCF